MKTSSNAFAVGKSGGASGGCNQTLIEHWGGSAWKQMSTPNAGPCDNELNGVAVGGDGTVAVGDHFNAGSPTLATLVLHFNGSAWKVQSNPNSSQKFNELTAVSEVPGTGHAWAVGFSSNTAGG